MYKEPKYKEMLSPEQLAFLNANLSRKMGIPIYFAKGDLADLFTMSLQDAESNLEHAPVDLETAPIDETLRDAMLARNSMAHMSKNSLVMGFSMLGYSSALGKKVSCSAFSVDRRGEVVPGSKVISEADLEPSLFLQFEQDPLAGARYFFSKIATELSTPADMLVMANISPSAHLN